MLRERGKPAVAYMVDQDRHYVGGAFITLNQKLRERLGDRVTGKASSPAPKGLRPKDWAQWLLPGMMGRVRHLKGEDELRHATLEEVWEA